MDSAERVKLINRINKLLLLAAKNPEASEARSARAMAYNLMNEYDIADEEVTFPGSDKAKQQEYVSEADYYAANQAATANTYQNNQYTEQHYQQQYSNNQAAAAQPAPTTSKFPLIMLVIILLAVLTVKYLYDTGHYSAVAFIAVITCGIFWKYVQALLSILWGLFCLGILYTIVSTILHLSN